MQYIPHGSAWRDAWAFAVLILVLVFRPAGPAGRAGRRSRRVTVTVLDRVRAAAGPVVAAAGGPGAAGAGGGGRGRPARGREPVAVGHVRRVPGEDVAGRVSRRRPPVHPAAGGGRGAGRGAAARAGGGRGWRPALGAMAVAALQRGRHRRRGRRTGRRGLRGVAGRRRRRRSWRLAFAALPAAGERPLPEEWRPAARRRSSGWRWPGRWRRCCSSPSGDWPSTSPAGSCRGSCS